MSGPSSSRWAPKPPPVKAFNSPVVKVSVGEPPKLFHIHKGLLIHYSIYFRSAYNGNWAVSNESIHRLEDEDAEIFQMFYTWLYNGQRLHPPGEDFDFDKLPLMLCGVWVFGDKRGVVGLKNTAMESLTSTFEQVDNLPEPSTLCYIYDNTSESSSLRKFFVHLVAINAERQDFSIAAFLKDGKREDSLPVEFGYDLAIALAEVAAVEQPEWFLDPGWEGYFDKS
ncbi:hypothetical protein BJ546DRAFT_851670 [Cryomyces antarcticus]